ncbi:MAG TPA: DNA mismatch repair protein MutS [Chloroflexota bacterium]|nr:DNA mismatch repair protein MutS [Chloroflexota bacterium]
MTSPAHRQYLAVKQRYPDAIVLFRMGDFYEMFGEDAAVGAEALQITLTSREFARGDRVPMAGIPHHALQSYLKRFMQHGLKVAICDQLSEPGKGLVERDVVRVVTPGTLVEPALLDESRNNYLAAVCAWKDSYGLAFVDVTTGEFAVTQFAGAAAGSALEAEMVRLAPSECLVGSGDMDLRLAGYLTVQDEYRFDPDAARDTLCRHFGVRSLEGFGCDALPAAVGAAGAILSYLERANRSLLGLLTTLRTYHTSAFMVLDRYTRRNLELAESARSGGIRGSLLWVLDRTATAMGGRLLRRRLSQPLLEVAPLETRLDAVGELVESPILRAQLRSTLSRVADLERVTGRVCQGGASPRDLLALRDSLRCLPDAIAMLEGAQCEALRDLITEADPCADLAELINSAVFEAALPERKERAAGAPAGQNLIKSGYSSELDDMKASIRDSREWIARLEPLEQQRTGIKSLKVGYNKVFGYYIEASNANLAAVPPEYIRKQTLVNAERYITPELKEHEARILQAEERIGAVERRVFAELLQALGEHADRLFRTANAVAELDVYRSLADVADAHRYVRPRLSASEEIELRAGRHPVVEKTLEDDGFIPNECTLDCDDHQILLITGPNMGGKSTYLRQVALTVLMAQIGSFVPAASATIGVVDRIFTRVGAQDDIAAGQSTFMVEMVETANILNHATRRSLLVLDEVGRGTSTYDGLAIARAVVEHIHETVGARTLFATHYQELTALADRFPRIYNASVAVAEDGHDVVFLHRLVPGGADRSYGIHVARLAGLPAAVTDRAEEMLHDLEEQAQQNGHRRSRRSQQLTLFGDQVDGTAAQILEELLALDLDNLTPLEALTRLHELQQQGRGG